MRGAGRFGITGRVGAVAAAGALLLVGVGVAPAWATTSTPGSQSFSTADVDPATGLTSWTVPDGVSSLTITATGGNGDSYADGRGAVLSAQAAVTPGTVLTIAVGTAGRLLMGGVPGGDAADFGGGGGWSGVRLPDGTPLVIAGAGGGDGASGAGGDADQAGTGPGAGGAGTQTAGGAAGGPGGQAGSQYQGGRARGGGGGGGGGGYFGGGGGGTGGGGGGSSFPAPGTPGVSYSIKPTGDAADGSIQITYQVTTATVTFDPQGGSPIPTATIPVGNTATIPGAPTRAGYRFDGWYTTPTDTTTTWNFTTPITNDLTLYAHWTPASAATPATPTTLAATGTTLPPTTGLLTALLAILLGLTLTTTRRRTNP